MVTKKEKKEKKKAMKVQQKSSKRKTKNDIIASKTRLEELALHKSDIFREETLIFSTNLEIVEEVQYTETSYTSASLESIPPPPVTEVKSKKKKRRKGAAEVVQIEKSDMTDHSLWSIDSDVIDAEVPPPVVDIATQTKSKGKLKGKGKGAAPGKGKGKKKEKEKKEGDMPEFEKPKKWKRMNLKERAEWIAARIEQWKAEVEAEKQAKLAGAKEKKLRLEEERNKLMEKEIREQDARRNILIKICNMFQKFENLKMEAESARHSKLEWHQYLRCDGLPDALKVQELNSYLTIWRDNLICTDDDLWKRYDDVFPMLEMIDIFTFNSKKYTAEQRANFDEIRLALLNQVRRAIECTCFHLLLDLEKNLNFKPVRLATYYRTFKNLKLHIWVAVKMPTRKPVEEVVVKENLQLSFPDIGLQLTLPQSMGTEDITFKIALSEVDLFSENTRTFALHDEMPNKYEDIFTFNVREFALVENLKKVNDEIRNKFYKEVNQRMRELERTIKSNPYLKFEAEKEELETLTLSEPPYSVGEQNPREKIVLESELAFKNYLKSCNIKIKLGEVNLRKYRICGGVLLIDPIKTPNQSKHMKGDCFIMNTFELPRVLKTVPYEVRYRPPPSYEKDERSPEEIQAELDKAQEERDKLVIVDMTLPSAVCWMEAPVVCQWQGSKQRWTTNYINELYYDELNKSIQFRAGILWPIGLATLRFSNLPLKTWSMRPEENGNGVIITVTGVHVKLTFLCRGRNVILKAVENAEFDALNRLIDKQMSVRRMLHAFREAGCDIFPDFDSYNYVEGSCPKEWVMERHNYHAMAFLSRAYDFQGSQWNKGAGYRTIVIQMREAVDKRVTRYQLLHVTPERATVLKGNENMSKYSDEEASDAAFYPDLFALNIHYGSTEAKKLAFNMKHMLTETVFEFLQELKLCSFS